MSRSFTSSDVGHLVPAALPTCISACCIASLTFARLCGSSFASSWTNSGRSDIFDHLALVLFALMLLALVLLVLLMLH
jgi:hypothetical protein